MKHDWLTLVADVARVAGDVAHSFYAQSVDVITKSDGSPVTVADRSAERAAREWIEARFAEDCILGEEFGETRPAAARRWILDPIDGTKTFVRGVPLWGTLVAVAEGERVLAGAAYFPVLGEMVAAVAGAGCYWNGARCAVSAVAELSTATVLTTDERFPKDRPRAERWRELAARASVSRTWGDCYGYMLVATGRAEVMADDIISPWDTAALFPIITEAGGVFTDWRGVPTAFGGDAIASNAALAQDARAILTGRGAAGE